MTQRCGMDDGGILQHKGKILLSETKNRSPIFINSNFFPTGARNKRVHP